MSTSIQEKVSRIHYDSAFFKWQIENFSVKNSLKNEGDFLESSPYKYSGVDWKLKLRRSSAKILLILSFSPVLKNVLLRIPTCEFHFFISDELVAYRAKHKKTFFQLVIDISMDRLKELFVADGVLTVSCKLKMEKIIDVQSTAETTTSVEGKSLYEGFATLAGNIGSIMNGSEFFDVTLKADNDTFQAHKVILSSRSKMFERMFKSGLTESKEGVFTMMDMKSSTLKEILNYIYTGKIEILSVDQAINLYNAADMYDLQELKIWGKDFIVEYISAEDVCNVAVLADQENDKELNKAVRKVFKDKCEEIMKSEGWKDFARNHLSVYRRLVEATLQSGC